MPAEIKTDITADIIKTLYDVEIAEGMTQADVADKIFPHRVELTLGFKEVGNPQHVSVITMSIPFGRVVCTPEEFEALKARLATAVSSNAGFIAEPMGYDEVIDYFEREQEKAQLASMEKYLAAKPREQMFEA